MALHQPNIILLDADLLGRNPENTLEKFRTISPRTRRAILVNDVKAAQLVPSHAEAVLIKGIPASAITGVVTELLRSTGDQDEPHLDSNQ